MNGYSLLNIPLSRMLDKFLPIGIVVLIALVILKVEKTFIKILLVIGIIAFCIIYVIPKFIL